MEVRLRALTGLAKQEAFVDALQLLIHIHTFIPKMLVYYVQIKYCRQFILVKQTVVDLICTHLFNK
jgi:hypothetical protein